MKIYRFLAAAAVAGALAVPAAAQYYPQQPPYAQPYQQTYPQQAYPGTGYGQGYGYNQGTSGNAITDIIDQLLGNNNRYSVTDRQAVRQCAQAAKVQAQSRYGGYSNGYDQAFAAPSLRVTSITGVQRRGNGVRVSGMMSSGYGGQYRNQYGNPHEDQYENQSGYQNRGYGGGDISFRCDVAYNGQVYNIRIGGGQRRY